jgi:hypothetical protein
VIEVVDDGQQDPERVAPDLWDPMLGELVDRARLAQRRDAANANPIG